MDESSRDESSRVVGAIKRRNERVNANQNNGKNMEKTEYCTVDPSSLAQPDGLFLRLKDATLYKDVWNRCKGPWAYCIVSGRMHERQKLLSL